MPVSSLPLVAVYGGCELDMRLLHTSDWHLGRLFHGVHLTDDQAHALDQLVVLAREERPDAVLVAGDVYDRAVPPPEAVALLDETLTRLAVELEIPVVMIAGNHDSPQRLGFGARLMAARGVHVVGSLPREFVPLTLEDEHGPVSIVALPYAEPPVVRERLGDDTVQSHDDAIAALVERALAAIPAGGRSVAVGHLFVAGGSESESERPLSVGGSAAVDARRFRDFTYTALGHLHRAQSAGSDTVRYCGSLLKYSFSEAAHAKSVTMVEIDERGVRRCEAIALTPRRDVRVLTGTLEEILAGPAAGAGRDDYVAAVLTDRGALLDAMGRIREVYPNCLHIDRSAFLNAADDDTAGGRGDRRGLAVDELFDEFVRQVSGDPLSEAESAAFREIVQSMLREEREAVDDVVDASAGSSKV